MADLLEIIAVAIGLATMAALALVSLGRGLLAAARYVRDPQWNVYPPGVEIDPAAGVLHPYWKSGLFLTVMFLVVIPWLTSPASSGLQHWLKPIVHHAVERVLGSS